MKKALPCYITITLIVITGLFYLDFAVKNAKKMNSIYVTCLDYFKVQLVLEVLILIAIWISRRKKKKWRNS